MAISEDDIVFYKALYNNDLTSNGGVISTTEIVSNVVNNLFPNVENADRIAGLIRYRKEFVRNMNSIGLVLYHGKLWIGIRSTGDDYFLLHLGTDTDTQLLASAYTEWAGTGVLDVPGTIGDPTIDVEYDAADGVYDGAVVRIDDGTQVEYKTVNGAPSWNGTVATLTLDSTLSYTFLAAVTNVMTVVDLGNLLPTISDWVEVSVAGTYDEDTYPLTLFNDGTVSDTWTLTFSDSLNFTVVGALSGNVGSGDITQDFEPLNASGYYFKIEAAGWGGAWATGDTITFQTYHAGQAVWVKQVVPAGIDSIANNRVTLEGYGESASATTTTTTSTTSTTTSSSTTTTSSSMTTTSSSTTTTTTA